MSATPKDNNHLFDAFKLMEPHEHPSADDIIKQQGEGFTLKGKVILVTGASSGIGVETARSLAAAGAKVFIAVRDVEKAKKTAGADIEIVEMALDDLASVSRGADDFLRRSQQLNILINNAGVMVGPYRHTKDGHEYQFGVNHLGHFLLFKKLLPTLLKSSTPQFQSRVVNVSSIGHNYSGVDINDLHWKTRPYVPGAAYGQSKTANILMANEIERRYGAQGVHAWSLHPGGIMTELSRHTTTQDLEDWGFLKDGKVNPDFLGMKMKTVPQGAATSVYAAVGKDLEGQGGGYLDNAKVSQAAAHATSEESARALWEYSEGVVQKYV